ncbi:MAG: hydrogenase nickel incorporation protein HypB [Cyanobacteriota bacterium]|jgi:hydrogenase nickel incorporation protein HypB
MCSDCQCGSGDASAAAPVPAHRHEPHHHHHHHATAQYHDAAVEHVPVGQRLLARNDQLAALNRQRFADAGVRVVNLLSSPGSGKTALLEALARAGGARMAVIVGDLATDNDARRLRQAGVPAVQITTGQACHLEASMVARAADELEAKGVPLASLDWLVIENVGNLVCPAAYDLGESLRVVLLSVTEGEDKPLKYPATFHSADLVLIGKNDLAAVVGFDRERTHANVARVAPAARRLEVSARSGEGLAELRDALSG